MFSLHCLGAVVVGCRRCFVCVDGGVENRWRGERGGGGWWMVDGEVRWKAEDAVPMEYENFNPTHNLKHGSELRGVPVRFSDAHSQYNLLRAQVLQDFGSQFSIAHPPPPPPLKLPYLSSTKH